MTKTHYILIAFAAALLCIGYLIYVNNKHETQIQELTADKETLQNQLATLQSNADSLTKTLHYKDSLLTVCREHPNLLLRDWDIENMKRQGLDNPVQNLKEDLMQHKELIAREGVHGGEMQFYSKEDIFILNRKWVLAYYEDGHNAGAMLLAYDVKQGGRINWKVIASSDG